MTTVERTFVTSVCRQCGAESQLETTGYSEWSIRLAQKTCAGWLCGDCYDAAERAEEDERNRVAASRATQDHKIAITRSKVPTQLPVDFALPKGPAADAALAWAHRRTLTLTLFGPVGTGKSTLARWAFMQRLMPVVVDGKVRGKPGAWRSMAGYMAQLGAAFGSPEKDDAVWLAQGGMVLGLDDLDKTTPNDFAASAVYALVNGAYESRSPLIVTCNATPQELAKRWPGSWGDAIVSRLHEGDIVELGGADRRMAKRRAA